MSVQGLKNARPRHAGFPAQCQRDEMIVHGAQDDDHAAGSARARRASGRRRQPDNFVGTCLRAERHAKQAKQQPSFSDGTGCAPRRARKSSRTRVVCWYRSERGESRDTRESSCEGDEVRGTWAPRPTARHFPYMEQPLHSKGIFLQRPRIRRMFEPGMPIERKPPRFRPEGGSRSDPRSARAIQHEYSTLPGRPSVRRPC